MTELVTAQVSGMAGPVSLPRRNGQLAFDAPWQGRLFGLALAIVDQLGLSWEEFRSRLIVAVADDPERPYWESWAAALEAMLSAVGALSADDLAQVEHRRA